MPLSDAATAHTVTASINSSPLIHAIAERIPWTLAQTPDRGDLMDPDDLDGCDLDFDENPTPDDAVELYPLFARALDPNDPKTIADVEREWGVG
jgi:hypothetical protein